jgi:hypothetical protein
MKQITFSDSQWSLLLSALTKLRLHRYDQWRDWVDNHRGILLAGLEQSRYQQFRDDYRAAYDEIAHLVEFCHYNAREIEEDKA